MKNGTKMGQKCALMKELCPLEVRICVVGSKNFHENFGKLLEKK